MQVDHIFIFSDKGKAADELVNFGFVEGSGRVHAGLGTANRRFFFEDFYLEILWVENESESKNEKSSRLNIWERSNFRDNNYSPYGLCLKNTDTSSPLFVKALKFQADYHPQGKYMEVVNNQEKPYLPWFFRLPQISGTRKNLDEPNNDKSLGIRKLTKAIFEVETSVLNDRFVDKIQLSAIVEFRVSTRNFLILEFDHVKQRMTQKFEKLDLEIRY